jgi:hypothetical protein
MTPQQIDRAWKTIARLRRKINGIRSREMGRLANSIGFFRVDTGGEPRYEKEGRPYPTFIPDHPRPLAAPTARNILNFLEGKLLWEEGLNDE